MTAPPTNEGGTTALEVLRATGEFMTADQVAARLDISPEDAATELFRLQLEKTAEMGHHKSGGLSYRAVKPGTSIPWSERA